MIFVCTSALGHLANYELDTFNRLFEAAALACQYVENFECISHVNRVHYETLLKDFNSKRAPTI